jgi:hypothetical protein
MFSRIPIGNLIIGVVAFVVCVYEGWRQMYRAKHVDRLEREGQIPPDMAIRIRKKPMKLIGWGLIFFGTFILFKEIFWF